MCLSDLGSNCGSDYIVSQGFTEAQKTEMLQIHNDLRAKVASGSANGLPTAGNLKRALFLGPRYTIRDLDTFMLQETSKIDRTYEGRFIRISKGIIFFFLNVSNPEIYI